MATVIDDDTGEEVQVVPVEAVAAVSSISAWSDLPPGAGKQIEEAMAAAASQCMEAGISEPDAVREAMLKARDSVRIALRAQMISERSQYEAAQQGR